MALIIHGPDWVRPESDPMPSGVQIRVSTSEAAREPESHELVEPSLLAKGVNFARASAQHAAAGFPKATDEQVAERFAVCQACPLYKPKGDGQGVCTHSSCGCSLKAVGLSGRNKLRWADQACPTGRWKSLLENAPSD